MKILIGTSSKKVLKAKTRRSKNISSLKQSAKVIEALVLLVHELLDSLASPS